MAVLVHEFRTPIVSLRSLAGALGSPGRLDAASRDAALELVWLHTEHLAAMLEQARTLAEPLEERAHVPPVHGSPPPHRWRAVVLAEAVHTAAHAAGLPRDLLDYTVDDTDDTDDADDADERVVTDPVALRRILTNLLENAVRHGRARCRVDVEVHRESGWLRIVVGNPVPANATDGLDADGRPGGLGVPIVVQLARSVGGSIRHRRTAERHEAALLLPRFKPDG